MVTSSDLARRVIREFSESTDSQSIINELIEHIENRLDPNPEEVYLLETLYQFVEKSQLLQSHLEKYIKKTNQKLKGNKLSELYDNDNKYGTSIFDK